METDNQENPFELLHRIDELSPDLKKKVIGTINLARLASKVGQLFSIDMVKTAVKMIDPNSNLDNKNEK